ncbi:sensor histidine kinase [Sphaerisporangium melleum]|uniref:sensor histidine kinase n=1 Tax=Sphaerisporangium melleum TaxID=321316 RepID=UPI00166B3EF7|nr:HAMP domain-containing sensor histidine kinase [Sphaerisporangium melleum]
MSLLVFLGLYRLAVSNQVQDLTVTSMRVSGLIHKEELPPVVPPQGGTRYIQVVGPSGRVVSSTPPLTGLPRLAMFTPRSDAMEAHQRICSPPGFPDDCLMVVVLRSSRPVGDYLVYGAAPAIPWYVNPAFLLLVGGASLLVTAATAAGTYRMVRRALAPVESVREELAEITGSDLSRRVPVPPQHDEIGALSSTVNQTLDRLQQAVEQQRRFASDAGHDLRSPITAMRTQVEDALLHPEDTDWVKMAEALVSSLDRLQAIVTDLLVLAKLDAGEKITRSYINMAELVRAEVGRRPRRRRVALRLQPGIVVSGDRLQLLRLLTNLLDNAERHATSTVTIIVGRDDGNAVLQVIDDGEGIPPDEREVVFQRFTRLSSGREKDTQGTGLGLAIARDVAEHHDGSLVIEDSPVGARFVLRLPLLTVP